MQNAKSLSRPPRSFLLVGPTGSGKTTQLRTLTGEKFLYAFDPNSLTSLQGADIDYEEWFPERDELMVRARSIRKGGKQTFDRGHDRRAKRTEPVLYDRWIDDVNAKYDAKFFADYRVLGIDSCTPLVASLMDRIGYLNDNVNREDERTDYRIAGDVLTGVMRLLTTLPLTLFVTAHIQTVKDDITNRIFEQFMLPGGAKTRVPLVFDNIWVCSCQSTREGDKYVVQTRPDRQNPTVRCTVPGLQMFEDVTITDFRNAESQGIGRFLKGN